VEFNADSKAEYSALSSTRSQKKKLKQTTPVPLYSRLVFLHYLCFDMFLYNCSVFIYSTTVAGRKCETNTIVIVTDYQVNVIREEIDMHGAFLAAAVWVATYIFIYICLRPRPRRRTIF